MKIICRKILFAFSIFMLLLAVNGCSSHEVVQPPDLFNDTNRFESSKQTASGQSADLFELLNNDPILNKTVADIIHNNYAVKLSLSRIKQTQTRYKITSASLMPYLSSGFSANKSQSVNESGEVPVASESERYSLSLGASYNIDLFGENRANLSAAVLEILAQVEEHKALLLSLINEFAVAWVIHQEAKSQIEYLEKTMDNDQANQRFITERYNLGLATLTDVYQAQQQVIVSKTKYPDYESRVRIQHYKIKQLSGLLKLTDNALFESKADLELPPVAVGLPSDLIAHRPDIKAALLRIKASNHQVAASIANQYPRISLTASGGTQSADLANLVNPDYFVWNLIGNITLPILDAGGKKAEVVRQKEILQEKIALYQSKLFLAFQDTNELLSRISLQKEKITLIKKQVEMAELILSETSGDYLQGLDEWSAVLSAHSKLHTTQSRLITAKKDLILLKVQLHTTLGSTWPDKLVAQQLDFLLEEIKSYDGKGDGNGEIKTDE